MEEDRPVTPIEELVFAEECDRRCEAYARVYRPDMLPRVLKLKEQVAARIQELEGDWIRDFHTRKAHILWRIANRGYPHLTTL
jgi:hypothetical protein